MIFDQLLTLAYVALAMILGAAIGYERESADKPAGLRTHMLAAVAAALLVAIGDVVIMHFDLDVSEGVIRTGPIRIIEAIITGVSFLGAGTIIYHRSEGRSSRGANHARLPRYCLRRVWGYVWPYYNSCWQ